MAQKSASTPRDLLKSTIFLCGAFAFALNAATALHELGHATAMWLTGGKVAGITLHPFSWSHTFYGSRPTHPVFTTWAGAGLGTAFALLLVVLAWRWRNPFASLLLMIGVTAMFSDGLYLLVDALMHSGGDGTDLVQMSTPLSLIAIASFLLVVGGMVLLVVFIPLLGIGPNESLGRRLTILGGGLFPYFIAIVIYRALFEPEEIGRSVAQVLAATFLVGLGALLSVVMQKRLSRPRVVEVAVITWLQAGLTLLLGIAVVVAELIVFR